MRPNRHLVIMVKAPRLGAVKTRLAADVGDAAARRFYRETTETLLRRVGRDPRWTCQLAVSPDGYARHGRFWPRSIGRFAQGTGNLGARMARPLRGLPPGPVIVVGSDVPHMDAGHIERAFRALAASDAVFGPATDGGYWLVGLRRRGLAHVIFRDVRWSTRHALADTLANLPAPTRVALVDTLADVDDGTDLARLSAR